MEKAYVVDFLSSRKQPKTRLSTPKTIDGFDMSKDLEALILERAADNYEFVSIQVHHERFATEGSIPTGYLVTFKRKNL